MNVTVWNEYHPSQKTGKCAKIYPAGLHMAIKDIFKDKPDITVRTATQEEPENGLTDKILDETDVLIWWGNIWHNNVLDSVVDKVCNRVLQGMGAIFLHSANESKPFRKLMGTTCTFRRKEDGLNERLRTINPTHPITYGVPDSFLLEQEELCSEYFDIPEPEEILYLGWFAGGEPFRSGCTFRRGSGKIFYFQPGHEIYPTFLDKNVQKIIYNAAIWASPAAKPHIPPVNEQTEKTTTRKWFKWK
jgi:trehalose utilization protein